MFRRQNLRPLLALLLLVQFAVLAEDDITRWSLDEPLFSPDYPRGITENDLKVLPLSAPKLRFAYIWLIRSAGEHGLIADEKRPEMVEILKDLRRRGESASPLLLDILRTSHDSIYQDYIPGIIAKLGTVKMDPYVEYLRKEIQAKPVGVAPTMASEALGIFFVYGTKEDVKMVEALAKNGPTMASAIQAAFEKEQRRTSSSPQPSESATTPAPTPAVEPQAPGKAPGINPASTTRSEASASNPWTIVTAVVSLAAALGLVWWWIKRRS